MKFNLNIKNLTMKIILHHKNLSLKVSKTIRRGHLISISQQTLDQF
jgi:hypothetical protein